MHGAAMFVGAYLYLDLKDREGRPSYLLPKLAAAALVLYLTVGLQIYAAIPMALILDVLLTTQNKTVVTIFSNRFWKALAPFTYGMYMTHTIFLAGVEMPNVFHTMVEVGDTKIYTCEPGYVYWTAGKAFVISLVMAVILHYTVELPANLIRKKYIKPKKSKVV